MTSLDVVFGTLKCSKCVFGRDSASDPAGGARSPLPDILDERKRIKGENKKKGKGIEVEDERGGSVKGEKRKERGPWIIFLQGNPKFKFTPLTLYGTFSSNILQWQLRYVAQ